MSIATSVVASAMLNLGIHEEPMGSNSGPEVDAFLAYVGLGPGNPWCAAYRCWLVHHVFVELSLPTEGLYKTGSTGDLVGWAEREGKVATHPEPGDAVCVKGNTETGYEHTATLIKVYPLGLLRTIDGNWGDKIAYAWHHVSQVTFVREWL